MMQRLVLFAKRPRPGRVKTRLVPPLTPEQALELYRAFLSDQGIGTAIYYPTCLHVQQCFSSSGDGRGDLPRSDQASAETLALPIYPELDEEKIARVAGAIGAFFDR